MTGMGEVLAKVTIFCFAASYGLALALELWHLVAPRPILRFASITLGAAGVLAHSIFVWVQPIPLGTPFGSLLFLGWILAVFYLYGAVHHHKLAWGLFALPVVFGLVVLAALSPEAGRDGEGSWWQDFQGVRVWGYLHGALVLLAAVGVCVGFVASVMYLVQVRRLRAKLPPTPGMKLYSLERIEAMNRRAILLSFPLLTAGLLVGIALQLQSGTLFQGWDTARILSSLGLWVVFAILLYLRYGAHARGRQVALLTVVAFALLLFALLSPQHPFAQGGGP